MVDFQPSSSGIESVTGKAIVAKRLCDAAGINKILELGLVDAYKPQIGPTNPFYVRVGICYQSENGKPADKSKFTIARGFHSYGGGTIGAGPDDLDLRASYNKLNDLYTDPSKNHQVCDNLVGNNFLVQDVPINLQCPSNPVPANCPYAQPTPFPQGPFIGCPANGITLKGSGSCTSPSTQDKDNRGQNVCVWPTDTLVAANSLSEITNSDGTYNSTTDMAGRTGLDKYYYDSATGWLFLYVSQIVANPVGPSPLGNCKDKSPADPACPNNANDETYYVCPPQGCRDYVITVTDPNYTPGVSSCPNPYTAGFGAPEPTPKYHLVTTEMSPMTVVRNPISQTFPHYAATTTTTPVCSATQGP
jgi:hypothetical protein